MTSQALQVAPGPGAVAINGGFTREQLDLLKRTVAEGTSDDEFALFLEVAKSSGLNPFQRQIYAIMRDTYNPKTKRKEPKMTIQTGIDGYRLTAARTGQHAGTTDAEYGPKGRAGFPEWARVTVKKLMPNGAIAEFPATARWDEYAQMKDEYQNGEKTGRQVPSGQWGKMPYLMLAKCAEALALRKAFPAELSGVYTAEEMAQADNPAPVVSGRVVDMGTGEVIDVQGEEAWTPSPAQIRRLYGIAKTHGIKTKEELRIFMDGIEGYPEKESELTEAQYNALCDEHLPKLSNPENFAPAPGETPNEEDETP